MLWVSCYENKNDSLATCKILKPIGKKCGIFIGWFHFAYGSFALSDQENVKTCYRPSRV